MIDIQPATVRRAILAAVTTGPQPLGAVVAGAEAAADDPAAARVAATLQAMARHGEITLTTDGHRWMVTKGRPVPAPRRFLCLADGLRRLRRRIAPAPAALV